MPPVLVIGKARTGTTALAHSLAGPGRVAMEPKTPAALERALAEPRHAVVKVLVDHFVDRLDDFHDVVERHAGPVSIIRRDIRDEMLSRLLYAARTDLPFRLGPAARRRWIGTLRAKEADPAGTSFFDLCRTYGNLTGRDGLDPVVNAAIRHESDLRATMARLPGAQIVAFGDLAARGRVETGRYAYTRRAPRSGGWREVFLPPDVEALSARLDEAGFDPGDWPLATPGRLDPAAYSSYVARTTGPRARLRAALAAAIRAVRA